MGPKPKLLVIGVDGAGPQLVDGFARAGAMPHTSALIARGRIVPLLSTAPPTTFPAWTSFLTGAPPSSHGLPDFTIRAGYRVRFSSARDRALPTLFAHAERHGLVAGAAWFPATYPPEPLAGFSISGWDSPVTSRGDASFVRPAALHRELDRRFGGAHLAFDAFDEFGGGPRDAAARIEALVRATARRAEIARWLLERRPVDLAAFYFGAADTAAHHFWAFHDPGSPRRPDALAPGLEAALADVYRAIDSAIGLLAGAVGDETPILVLSDHGSRGASDVVVRLNRLLADAGLLAFSGRRPTPGSGAVRSSAAAAIPRRLRRGLFRFAGDLAPTLVESELRFGGIDWRRTRAFSEELTYAPSVWINQLGREPQGRVRFRDRLAVAREVAAALAGARLEDGRPIGARVVSREAAHRGPFRHRFPDLAIEFADVDGYAPVCLPSRGPGAAVARLEPAERLGRKGRSMPGCHAAAGILIAAGPGTEELHLDGAAIEEVAPLVCRLLGVPPAPWFERRAEEGRERSAHGRVPPGIARAYTLSQERAVAARLRGLGYLEE